MNQKQIQTKLDDMVHKTFNYGGRIHCVLSYQLNGKLVLKTNQEEYERPLDSIPDFLDHWEPFDTTKNVLVPIEAPMLKETNMVNTLTDLLMDNIDKVKNDAGYIKQAQAINNNVNSIINLTKLKLDVIKQSRIRK